MNRNNEEEIIRELDEKINRYKKEVMDLFHSFYSEFSHGRQDENFSLAEDVITKMSTSLNTQIGSCIKKVEFQINRTKSFKISIVPGSGNEDF